MEEYESLWLATHRLNHLEVPKVICNQWGNKVTTEVFL